MAMCKGRMSAAGMGYFYGLGDLQTLRNQLALAKSHLSSVRGTPVSWEKRFRERKTGGMEPRDREWLTVLMHSNYAQVATGAPQQVSHSRAPWGTKSTPPAHLVSAAKTAIDTATHNIKAIEEQIAEAEKAPTPSLLPAATNEQQAEMQVKNEINTQWTAELEKAKKEREAALEANRAIPAQSKPTGPTSVREVLPAQQVPPEEAAKSNLMPLLLLGGGAVALFFVLKG